MGREDAFASFLIAELRLVRHHRLQPGFELFGDIDNKRGSDVVVERGVDDFEWPVGKERPSG